VLDDGFDLILCDEGVEEAGFELSETVVAA